MTSNGQRRNLEVKDAGRRSPDVPFVTISCGEWNALVSLPRYSTDEYILPFVGGLDLRVKWGHSPPLTLSPASDTKTRERKEIASVPPHRLPGVTSLKRLRTSDSTIDACDRSGQTAVVTCRYRPPFEDRFKAMANERRHHDAKIMEITAAKANADRDRSAMDGGSTPDDADCLAIMAENRVLQGALNRRSAIEELTVPDGHEYQWNILPDTSVLLTGLPGYHATVRLHLPQHVPNICEPEVRPLQHSFRVKDRVINRSLKGPEASDGETKRVALDADTLYLSDPFSCVTAIHRNDYSPKWKKEGVHAGPLTVDHRFVYVIDEKHPIIHVLHKTTGAAYKTIDRADNWTNKWGRLCALVADYHSGELYVSYRKEGRIQVLDANGDFKRGWYVHEDRRACTPLGLALHQSCLYVSDRAGETIRVFDLQGAFMHEWDVDDPAGLAVIEGHVYVANCDNEFVHVFTLTGDPVVADIELEVLGVFSDDEGGGDYGAYGVAGDDLDPAGPRLFVCDDRLPCKFQVYGCT